VALLAGLDMLFMRAAALRTLATLLLVALVHLLLSTGILVALLARPDVLLVGPAALRTLATLLLVALVHLLLSTGILVALLAGLDVLLMGPAAIAAGSHLLLPYDFRLAPAPSSGTTKAALGSAGFDLKNWLAQKTQCAP
jgi:hypothetical protein